MNRKELSRNKFAAQIQTKEILFRCARGVYEQSEKEFHMKHEMIFLLEGEAEFVSEYGRMKLTPHTGILIPGGTIHQCIYPTDEESLLRCGFQFGEVSELSELIGQKCEQIMLLKNERISELFLQLAQLPFQRISQVEKELMLKAYLVMVLVHINRNAEEAVAKLSSITDSAISYINDNLKKELSLQILSEQLHVSSSYLSHTFKNDMKISVHKYILNRRLVQAQRLLQQAYSPAQAAEECGFRDYSNFYLQYKKRFGAAPSQARLAESLGLIDSK